MKDNKKRVIRVDFEVTDNFELQLEDIRKMLSNKYKNDFFQVLWIQDTIQEYESSYSQKVGDYGTNTI